MTTNGAIAPSVRTAAGEADAELVSSLHHKVGEALALANAEHEQAHGVRLAAEDERALAAKLLADELRASGFRVLPADGAKEPNAVRVDGSLLKLFVEPVQGAFSGSLEADLSVKLRLTSGNGLDAERTFFVKGWKGGQLVSTMQPYHTALHRATQDLLAQMVGSIVELMNRYPELGANPPSSESFALGDLFR